MDERSYFKPFHYQSRLTKYSSDAYYLDRLDKNGNLRDTLMKVRVYDQDKVFYEQLGADVWNADVTEAKKEEIRLQLVHKQSELVDGFFISQLNQSLVTLCTVFDTFLVDCVDVITYVKPQLLKSLCSDTDITIEDLINHKTYSDVFNEVQSRFISRFDFAGIDKRLKHLAKMGISSDDLFNISKGGKPEFATKYPDAELDFRRLYEIRNDIVHREKIGIKNYAEFSYYSDLLLHLIFKWGVSVFPEKFGNSSDLILVAQGKIKI